MRASCGLFCRCGSEETQCDQLIACAEDRRRSGKTAPQFGEVLDALVASIDSRIQYAAAEGQPPGSSGAPAQCHEGAIKKAIVCSGSVLDRSTTAKKVEHFKDVAVALGERNVLPEASRHRSTYDRWEQGMSCVCACVRVLCKGALGQKITCASRHREGPLELR